MKTNEILEEIHRVREQHARECGYDVDVMFTRMNEDIKKLEAEGWKFVSPEVRKAKETSYVLREQPQKKKQ
jgi:hypothetical protein